MKYAFPVFVLSAIVLAGCQQNSSITKSNTSQSSAYSAASSSAQYVHWKNHQDAKLAVSIEYPSDEYSVTQLPSDDFIQLGDKQIAIEGIRIGDTMPEGNGIQLYRTKDVHILDSLKQQNTFSETKVINGMTWQEYECTGGCMGDSYGYVTEKNGWHYVFESMWGPNNPVSEKMLQSLEFN